MNLVFRMVKVLLAALFGRRLDLMDESVLTFRVWPNDLDVNLHMNNGRYLTVMDLGRTDLMIRCGLARPILRNRWMPVLGEASVRFRRSLKPFQRFRLHTRVLGWDAKWVYMEHRIESMDGRVAAAATVRGLFKSPAGTVEPAEILRLLGRDTESPPIPLPVPLHPHMTEEI
ncbi:thioesterase family protein [Skermanella sp. TT6]|uniref:Thioesterase family protein n=1 Tax=Skermanella cutis TaxID=2775420 RepID=A0ABX7B852_9PROT|nr:acyl-CoA thioesterase [Skermanella sp. TT6]QQP90319.1 thioesterase family protein [Skermanella sp. TT6]